MTDTAPSTPVPALSISNLPVAMAGFAALLMFVNAARALLDPVSFATYLGLPLAAPEDAGLIGVYASRAMFIGLSVSAMMTMRQWRVLAAVALLAVVMPLGDAILTFGHNAPTGTTVRHMAIAAYLLLTGILLWRRSE